MVAVSEVWVVGCRLGGAPPGQPLVKIAPFFQTRHLADVSPKNWPVSGGGALSGAKPLFVKKTPNGSNAEKYACWSFRAFGKAVAIIASAIFGGGSGINNQKVYLTLVDCNLELVDFSF